MNGFFANLKLLWPWSQSPPHLGRFDEALVVVHRNYPRAQLRVVFETGAVVVHSMGVPALFPQDREALADLARRCASAGYLVEQLADGGVRVSVRSGS